MVDKMKKVIIVHGWGGNPNGDWFPWLKKELKKNRFEVIIPSMPDSDEPEIKKWVEFLEENISKVDEETYFIGHSIGCQAIMRYLEILPEKTKVGVVVFVAGWFNLTDDTWDENYTKEIAEQWIKTPIDFNKIKRHTENFIAIQSDNDPYVPLSDKEIFKEKLNAKIILLHNKGHISGEDGIKELPVVLNEILK